MAGRSVLLVDDLMATGGTMMAAKSLLRCCEAACVVIIELAALGGRAVLDVPAKGL